MAVNHISLERRFSSLTEDLKGDLNYVPGLDSLGYGFMRWKELYQHRCVVILGEGNCGKTHEFRQQHQKRREEGVFSFFVPLESLYDNDFCDCITGEEDVEFSRWLKGSDKDAVFFLDAVDELKLRKGILRKALRKIKEAIGTQGHRAQFFISCRPNDWCEELDIEEVAGLVAPEKQTAKTVEGPDGEELFTTVIARKELTQAQEDTGNEDLTAKVKVLTLLPLTRTETVEFANLYKPDYAKRLETYLEDKELWHLYQRPADIISALDQLVSHGYLGNLEEQLSFSIGHKLRELSGKKRNTLSEDSAMEGAERIALALFMMKRRTIYLETQGGDAEGVSVADILVDWPSDELIELLGKPLFELTGIGAFRFHHRSTQEFLAAKRLKKLLLSGLAKADLFNLLFADIGNEQVIVPSMEPVVAWMATWNNDILLEVKKRNPLLLFRQGIPALLNIEERADLIRRFVEKYHSSEWRRVGVGFQELKRVASPELAQTVCELWEKAYTGHDTRELLLELVYLTPMPDCSNLTFKAAFDEKLPYQHRTIAARAVLISGTSKQKQDIGTSIVENGWPEIVVRNIIPELLPEAIDLDEFITLALSMKEVPRSVHGLGYALLQTIKSDALTNEQTVFIRDKFTKAVWENRTAESKTYQAHSQYDHFVAPLIVACSETVPIQSEDTSGWAWSLAVAFHFGECRNSIIAKAETANLVNLLSTNLTLREAYFWACLELAEGLESSENDWQRFIRTDYDRMLRLSNDDLPWLLQALSTDSKEEKRGVAFYTLSMFVKDEENPGLAERISKLVLDRADFSEELKKILNPPPLIPDKYDIEHRNWQKKHEAKETKRIDDWKRWREKVLADKEFLLSEDNRDNTLYNLHRAIQLAVSDNGKWGHWNSKFVETAFSFEFLEKVREELARYWRQTDVQLYSERPEDSRNSHPASSLMALAAVKCSAEDPGWSKALSHEDAVKAVRISTIELNGFASYLAQIEVNHPLAVEEVLAKEIQAQVDKFLDVESVPIFHDVLYHGTQCVKKVAVNSIIQNLPVIITGISESERNDIKYAFELVALEGDDEAVRDATCAIQALIDSSKGLTVKVRNFLICALSILDMESACENLLASTNDLSTEELRDDAISLFAAIFGERHMGGQPSFDGVETSCRLNQLKKLVIRAYQAIKPKDDLNHEGHYSPNTRDNAQHARGYLLQCLALTNSPKALSILYELSSLPEFSHLSDRLKQMATELAALISEPEAMNAVVFREFDKEGNYIPYDKPSLFTVMKNRLADFEHHILNDEQSTVDTLRKVDGETEVRRFISYWLNQNSRGAYTISQEAVVVAEKRTDIRLQVKGLDRYASIEVKLDDRANKWSGRQLREALEEQLVGRYLNHERCEVGCLLICMREARRWEHPVTKKYMNLTETVFWLQGIADEIMENRPELFIVVKGLDYSATANETSCLSH